MGSLDAISREFAREHSDRWFAHLTLLPLGGGVLIGLRVAAFGTLDLDIEHIITDWVLPFGAAGAVIVAAPVLLVFA